MCEIYSLLLNATNTAINFGQSLPISAGCNSQTTGTHVFLFVFRRFVSALLIVSAIKHTCLFITFSLVILLI